MSHLLTYVAKVVFYLLAAALFVWTASLTVAFVGQVLPDIAIARYFALVVFDVGVIAWLLIFLYGAQGLGQRAVALLASVFDLAGVGLMVLAELFLGGQSLVAVPADLGAAALWGIGVWTFLNLVCVVVYHIVEPDTMKAIAVKNVRDKVEAASLKELDRRMDEITARVAAQLADGLVSETLAGLNVPRVHAGNVSTGGEAVRPLSAAVRQNHREPQE